MASLGACICACRSVVGSEWISFRRFVPSEMQGCPGPICPAALQLKNYLNCCSAAPICVKLATLWQRDLCRSILTACLERALSGAAIVNGQLDTTEEHSNSSAQRTAKQTQQRRAGEASPQPQPLLHSWQPQRPSKKLFYARPQIHLKSFSCDFQAARHAPYSCKRQRSTFLP